MSSPLFVLRGQAGEVQCTVFLSEILLAAGHAGGEVTIWDLQQQRTLSQYRLHDAGAGVLSLQTVVQGELALLLSQGRDGLIKAWTWTEEGVISREAVWVIASESYNFCRCAVLGVICGAADTQTKSASSSHGGGVVGPTTAHPAATPVAAWAAADVATATAGATPATPLTTPTAAAGATPLTTPAAAAAGGGIGQSAEDSRNSVLNSGSISCNSTGTVTRWLLACAAHNPAHIDVWDLQDQRRITSLQTDVGGAVSHGMCMALACYQPLLATAVGAAQRSPMISPPQHAAQQGGTDQQVCDQLPDQCLVGNEPRAEPCNADRCDARHSSQFATHSAVVHDPPDSQLHGSTGSAQQPSDQWELGACHIVAGYEDGMIAVWNVHKPQAPIAKARLHEEPAMCVAVGPGGSVGASGSADSKVCFFSPAGHHIAQRLRLSKARELPKPGTADVVVRPDGRIVVSGGWDGKVRVFDGGNRKPLAVLQYHRAHVTNVCFSPSMALLASSSRDGTVAIWSVYSPCPTQAD